MNKGKKFCDYAAMHTGHRSHEEAVDEVQRECDVRRRLYDKWVADGKLSRSDAHDRLERLLAALAILTGNRAGSVPTAAANDPFAVVNSDDIDSERQAA